MRRTDPRYSRFMGIVDPTALRRTRVAVIGVGAIGSHVATELARLGVGLIHLHDPDKVSEVNYGVQNYDPADIGKPKVIAIGEKIRQINPDVKLQLHGSLVKDFQPYFDSVHYIFTCLDSIEDRRKIFDEIKDGWSGWLIDPRMGAEVFRLVTAKIPEWNKEYENSLFSQEEAEQAPCTMKATVWNSMVVAGFAVGSLIRTIRRDPLPVDLLVSMRDYTWVELQNRKELKADDETRSSD